MGGQYNGSYYQKVSDENREVRAKVQHKATLDSLIDKLLNNPHTTFRWEPMRHRLPAETKPKHQQQLNAVGHGERDLTIVGDASLTAQRPLLDGGEGKLLLPYTDAMDIDSHVEQEIPPMGTKTSSQQPLDLPPNIPALEASNLSGLEPPSLDSGGVVMAFVMLCPMVATASSLARMNPASQQFSDGNGFRKLRTSIIMILSPTQS